MSAEGLVLLGAGGHARVLADALRLLGRAERAVVLDASAELHGTRLLGILVAGGDDLLCRMRGEGFTQFLVAVGGIRAFGVRRRLFEAAMQAGLEPGLLRHPSSVVAESVKLGAGSQVLAGAIVNACAEIGENVILNSGSIVEHDCVLGSDVHIAPRACLAGGVRVGRQVHIGAGATICENLRIGDRAIVGAGAVVIRDVPSEAVVAGVPAKAIRRSGS
jgi:UDP-perosamine 4-acetyltransferase